MLRRCEAGNGEVQGLLLGTVARSKALYAKHAALAREAAQRQELLVKASQAAEQHQATVQAQKEQLQVMERLSSDAQAAKQVSVFRPPREGKRIVTLGNPQFANVSPVCQYSLMKLIRRRGR